MLQFLPPNESILEEEVSQILISSEVVLSKMIPFHHCKQEARKALKVR